MIVTKEALVRRYSQERTDALVDLYLVGTLTDIAHSVIIAELASRDIDSYDLYQKACLSGLAHKAAQLRIDIANLTGELSDLESKKKQIEGAIDEAAEKLKGVKDGSINAFELSNLAKNGFTPIAFLSLIVIAIGILNMPYGYYTFLRLVLCGSAIYGAFLLEKKGSVLFWVMVVFAILYNPIVPIELGDKEIWFVFNVATLGMFFWVSWLVKR